MDESGAMLSFRILVHRIDSPWVLLCLWALYRHGHGGVFGNRSCVIQVDAEAIP